MAIRNENIIMVEWFYVNVKFWFLGFLIFQISQMSQCSLISTNFSMDFLFGSGLPSYSWSLVLN